MGTGTYSIFVAVLTCTCILLLPSDGSCDRYKHVKNSANIRHNSDNFGLECERNFFVTSHMVKPYAMELEEQLNDWQHGQAFKVHWKDRSCQ